MTAREQFHNERRAVVGGSDVAVLFGLDRFRTMRDLWLEKTGQLPPDERESPDIRRGRRMEAVIESLVGEALGVPETGQLYRPPFLVHPDAPFLGGHVDWLFTPVGDTLVPQRVVEGKAPSRGAWGKIQREGLPFSNLLQMQAYLEIFAEQHGSFALYCADVDEFVMFPVERDREVGARIIAAAEAFWQHVTNGTEPPEPVPDEIAAIEKALPTVPGSVVRRTDAEWVAAVEHLREAKRLSEEAGAIEKAAKDRVKALAGGYGCFEGGAARIYYRQMAGRTSFDRKALEGTKPLDRISMAALITEATERPRDTDDPSLAEVRARLFDAIEQGHADVDLAQFDKQGNPYEEIRTYFLGGTE